ncbi:MAG: response regulator, partial [Planctomycetota bacterium]|nr:response regulator [Planctomycetota bacterium]
MDGMRRGNFWRGSAADLWCSRPGCFFRRAAPDFAPSALGCRPRCGRSLLRLRRFGFASPAGRGQRTALAFRQQNALSADKIAMESARDKSMHLLLVDDDPRLRELTSRRLASEGYEVETAVDGEDGWEKAQARVPDIIVSDIIMPRLNGLDLLERLRRHPQLRECYVILLTAKDRAEDVSAGFAALANDYVTKPFRMAELVARVHAGARLKRAQDELRQANQRLREALRQRAELLGIAA